MKHATELSPRTQRILEAVVKCYIETGQPVASRAIAKQYEKALSPASIRNVMQDLDEEGYLSQPHTSAGRIPTLKAFRCYVHGLRTRALPVEQVDRARSLLAQYSTTERRVELCSLVLTDLTNNVALTAVYPGEGHLLSQIELVQLPDSRVLVCVVMRNGSVHNRVIQLSEGLPPVELVSIRNYINENFSGWSLVQARAELERRLKEERAQYDTILRRLLVLYGKGLLAQEHEAELHLQGVSTLLTWQCNLTQERLREVFRALEHKQRMLEMLDRFLEAGSGELSIQVGLEEAHPTMQELALIGTGVHLSDGTTVKIGVVGPMRMRYTKVMSAVLQMGQAFETLPS